LQKVRSSSRPKRALGDEVLIECHVKSARNDNGVPLGSVPGIGELSFPSDGGYLGGGGEGTRERKENHQIGGQRVGRVYRGGKI